MPVKSISYHSWYTFSTRLDFKVPQKYDNPPLYRAGCFDCFWGQYQGNSTKNYFIFGWDAVPLYIEEVIESFNKTFKNIKISVLDSDLVKYNDGELTFRGAKEIEKEKANAKTIILTIELDGGYSFNCIKYLWYEIHQLFRMLSLSEAAYTDSRAIDSFVRNHEERDFCKLVSSINKYWLENNYSYRGIEYDFPPENVLLLDDIELVNNVFGSDSSVKKQTDILFKLFYNSKIFTTITKDSVAKRIRESLLLNGNEVVYLYDNKLVFGKPVGITINCNCTNDYSTQRQFYRYSSHNQNDYLIIIESKDFVGVVGKWHVYPFQSNKIYNNEENHYTCNRCSSRIGELERHAFNCLCKKCHKSKTEEGFIPKTSCCKHMEELKIELVGF